MYLTTAFHFSQTQVGLFSLTGVAGASSAFFSSRILEIINYRNNTLFFLVVASLLVMGFFTELRVQIESGQDGEL